MGMPLTMAGSDRRYQPPRSAKRAATQRLSLLEDLTNPLLERVVAGAVTAWDLFALEHQPEMDEWATQTLDSLVATADAVGATALGCTDCADTGFYGVPDSADDDLLVALVRRVSDSGYEALTAAGDWTPWTTNRTLEVLSLDLAGDLAAAITGGACGLLRRYAWPRAFLPPCAVVSAAPIREALEPLISAGNPATPRSEWVNLAVVDDADPGAVLELIRGDTLERIERYDDGHWVLDSEIGLNPELAVVSLTDADYGDVLAQMTASLVADAPLTVSPNPKAEKLRRYWSTGRGGAKIRWTAPGSGDFMRCYRHLKKYMGIRAKGYCANLHKRNTGVWPGDHRNTGKPRHTKRSLLSHLSPEESLLASVRTGQWGRNKERNPEMPLEMELLTDGIYVEGATEDEGIQRTITAGGFPVAPPDDWFKNPNFTGKTPMEITDKGQVYGHLATWDQRHVGMQAATHAPRSASDYAYYLTGSLKLESGKQVNVGQITVAGGHADINGNAQAAVQHYDDTNSAIADVSVGEDRFGIWAAGSLRPGATPEQIRVFRASPPSGDWRPINGHLEMVACCSVNVPGFMNVRPTARVAGGAVLALVAAGTAELRQLALSRDADAALLERVTSIEAKLSEFAAAELAVIELPVAAAVETAVVEAPAVAVEEGAPPAEVTAVADDDVVELSSEEAERAARIAKTREEVAAIKQQMREALRAKVHASAEPEPTTAALPPQFAKGKDKSTVSGTDSFPIGNVADLKKAIQAIGRAKDPAAAKKHIISMAYKLKRPDLIPSSWSSRTSK